MQEVHLPTAKTKARTHALPREAVDVAVIGAGLGGLTAAAYLAQHGLSVAVFDPHYVAGGCATQFSRGGKHGRYTFDVGLHYIGDCKPGGMIPTVLGNLGIEQVFVPMDEDGFDTLVMPDLTFKVPVSREAYRARLVEHFPEQRRGIDRYLKFVDDVRVPMLLAQQKDGQFSPLDLLTILFRGTGAAIHKTHTLGTVLDSVTRDPKLRAVLAGMHGNYGLPPSQVAAVFHAAVVNHFFQGAFYPRGGGQAISDKVADAIEAAGGSIHLRQGIGSVIVEHGRAVGVRTAPFRGDPVEVRARFVLSNADPIVTAHKLVGAAHWPRKFAERSARFTMPAGLFLTCLGIRKDLVAAGMRSTNYWLLDDYDLDGAYQKSQRDRDLTPRGAYITSATCKDPDTAGHAPEGVGSVEIMTLLPAEPEAWGIDRDAALGWDYKHDEAYQAKKQAIEDDMVERLERLFPGCEDAIVFRESATPLSHMRYTQASAGTGYGIAATPDQVQEKRLEPRSPLPGLYFCGASTRQAHGIMGVMLSGRDAARRIAEDSGRKLRW